MVLWVDTTLSDNNNKTVVKIGHANKNQYTVHVSSIKQVEELKNTWNEY